MKPTHHCIICGKGYISCDSCRNVRTFTPWRVVACTERHYQFYLLIRACQSDPDNDDLFAMLEQMSQTMEMRDSVAHDVEELLKQHK